LKSNAACWPHSTSRAEAIHARQAGTLAHRWPESSWRTKSSRSGWRVRKRARRSRHSQADSPCPAWTPTSRRPAALPAVEEILRFAQD